MKIILCLPDKRMGTVIGCLQMHGGTDPIHFQQYILKLPQPFIPLMFNGFITATKMDDISLSIAGRGAENISRHNSGQSSADGNKAVTN
jgi:hypothetical protein